MTRLRPDLSIEARLRRQRLVLEEDRAIAKLMMIRTLGKLADSYVLTELCSVF